MIDILNGLLNVVTVIVSQLIGLLPSSPLTLSPSAVSGLSTVMGYAAYWLPLSEASALVGALVAATLVWYGVRLVLRFVRVVTA